MKCSRSCRRIWKNHRWKPALWLCVLLAVTWLVWRFGHRESEEWDLYSGKRCHVHKVFGIHVWRGKAGESLISEWLGGATAEPDWITVKVFPKKNIAVSWMAFTVNRHLSHIEPYVKDPESRRAYAKLILEELRRARHISEAASRCAYADEFFFASVVVNPHDWKLSPGDMNLLWERARELLIADHGPEL